MTEEFCMCQRFKTYVRLVDIHKMQEINQMTKLLDWIVSYWIE